MSGEPLPIRPIRLPPRHAPTNKSTPLPGPSQAHGEGIEDNKRLLGLGSSCDGGSLAQVDDNLMAPMRKNRKRGCRNEPEDKEPGPSKAAKQGKTSKPKPVRSISDMADNMLTPLLQH
jgi:hypothetical protein